MFVLPCFGGYHQRLLPKGNGGILHCGFLIGFLHSSILIEGGDQITVLLTFFLILVTFLRIRAVTTGRRLRRRRFQTIVISRHLIFGLDIHLEMSVIYFHALVGKLNARGVVDGTAIY